MFRLPHSLPNGEYLLRVEQIALHSLEDKGQFYISCAQIQVTEGGDGKPGPLVEFPGAYTQSDPFFNTLLWYYNLTDVSGDPTRYCIVLIKLLLTFYNRRNILRYHLFREALDQLCGKDSSIVSFVYDRWKFDVIFVAVACSYNEG